MKGWRAIVLGGTGATGRELVRELIESPKWSRITLINRRQADEFQSDKVEQVVVNMDEMEQHADSFKDHDVLVPL
ncbi:HIV1 Tat interactive protein, putative [Acanthamoeba castellanii str. Neff]|uniref:HIV1 Tat interactive protein, putative n=1 Tax=Acanthamoeba castellanii (strain ATCC 30010 / Neff) TaxID=1257118 RepID=L8HB17_ACACF|nr:HIV1 Tat interactive protein, putative [Acanthamoeba castellanii str. Neff]ELR22699.1 HIV1 Tat interactive protein, putative [Acanthamoeba castellanii str. Neff]